MTIQKSSMREVSSCKSKATREKLEGSIRRVCAWVEARGYKAYDPGDGNESFLHVLTFHNLLLERVLQQAVLRVPFNVRPLIGIKPHVSTKGMGYMAWGYVKMYRLTGDASYRERAESCLDWLIGNRAPEFPQYCWGNHFSFSTRGGRLTRLTPTIVWSSLIGHAFLEAYEALGNERYLEVAVSVCDWIDGLPRERSDTGVCLSYGAHRQVSIHNSNMLGAGLLARVAKITQPQRDKWLTTARAAMAYSCARQHLDGSWFYGEAPKYHWIDNFHTGYNLDSLRYYSDSTGDPSFEENLRRGLAYFMSTFFERDGRPRYYHNKTRPIDIQCASQAIDTLAFFSDRDRAALGLASKVAAWTIDNMQDPDGHFYFRHLGWIKVKTPMLHWGQATMFKAMAHLCERFVA
jgi:hypothetical protein